MRHFLLSTSAAGAMLAAMAAVPASAADLPVRATPAPAYAPVAAFTWSGFYIGGNAGVAWRDADDRFGFDCGTGLAGLVVTNCGGLGFFDDNGGNAGFTGGLTVGANAQFGQFVLGVEGDINYIDLNGDDDNFGLFGVNGLGFTLPPRAFRVATGVVPGPLGLPGGAYTANWNGGFDDEDDNWFATLRVRGGIAFDRFLIYATGGVAFLGNGGGNGGDSVTVFNAVAQNNQAAGTIATTFGGTPAVYTTGFADDDDNNIHPVVGGGIEWGITNNISLKVEYLHIFVDGGDNNGFRIDPIRTGYFGDRVYTFGDGDRDRDIDIVRAGLNFRFNLFTPPPPPAPAPVVTKG